MRKSLLFPLPHSAHKFMSLAALSVLWLVSGCSLLKIELEQEPLSVNDLNTRLLIQAFAGESLQRTEIAADSIIGEADGIIEFQKNAILWKLQTASALSKISFQTVPRVALVDTWSYMLEMQEFMNAAEPDSLFGVWTPVAIETIDKNAQRAEEIAATVLTSREFPRYKEFVEKYAREHPLRLENKFRHIPIRDDYMAFMELPDSTAVRTVGTLSQVVSDAANRFDFGTEVASKRFSWQTTLFLKEQGLDSVSLEAKLATLEYELQRLTDVAVSSPEILSAAIEDFRNSVYPIFTELNAGIGQTMIGLSRERAALDLIIMRERVALDTLILRERIALSQEAREIADIGIKNAFREIRIMFKGVLVFIILTLIIILAVPFYLGYITGRRTEKLNKD